MDSQDFQISSTLKVSVHQGSYGRYIKVHRAGRWISFSASLWKLINKYMNKLRTEGYRLHLTKAKRLEVIRYDARRFVSVVEEKPGSGFKSFINFNDEEWSNLEAKMENINLALRECNTCHNLKRPIVVKNNRMVETRISQKEVERIHQYNLTVQNQLGAMCTYCGEEIRDDCHCHEFNCKTCEPQNFCSTCHVIVVCPVI